MYDHTPCMHRHTQGKLVNMEKFWNRKKIMWKRGVTQVWGGRGAVRQGHRSSIHSVFSCVCPSESICVCVFSAPGASCSSPPWKRKRKRKPELTHTQAHTAYSHVYTISFFWVKVSGHRWRICSDRTGTTTITTEDSTTQCNGTFSRVCVMTMSSHSVYSKKTKLSMLHVKMWTCINCNTHSNIQNKSSD